MAPPRRKTAQAKATNAQRPTDATKVRDDTAERHTPDEAVQAADRDKKPASQSPFSSIASDSDLTPRPANVQPNSTTDDQNATNLAASLAGNSRNNDSPSIHITTELYANWGVNDIVEIVGHWLTTGEGKRHQDCNVWRRDLQDALLKLSRSTKDHGQWVKEKIFTLYGNRKRSRTKEYRLGRLWHDKEGKILEDIEHILEEVDKNKHVGKSNGVLEEARREKEAAAAAKQAEQEEAKRRAAAENGDADQQPDGSATRSRGKKDANIEVAHGQGNRKAPKGAKAGGKRTVGGQTAGAKAAGPTRVTPQIADAPPAGPAQPRAFNQNLQNFAGEPPNAPDGPQTQRHSVNPDAPPRLRRLSDLTRANTKLAIAQAKRAQEEAKLEESKARRAYYSVMEEEDDEVLVAQTDIAEAQEDFAAKATKVGHKRWAADIIREVLRAQGEDVYQER